MTNLAQRESAAGAIKVSLDLDEQTQTLTVTAEDRDTGQTATHRTTDGRTAMEAYRHPWSYGR